jgi:hypothetical protein
MRHFHILSRDLLHASKSTTWDPQLYFPSKGRPAEDFFFALKNPTASAGFEPANLGTKGQHATSRPPKPLLSVPHDKQDWFSLQHIITTSCYGSKGWLQQTYRIYLNFLNYFFNLPFRACLCHDKLVPVTTA